MFSNREIAVGTWLILFLIYALTKREVRESVVGLIKVALKWKILLPIVLLIAYELLVIIGLSKIGIWTPSLLKDTILWFCFSGMVLAFSFMSKYPEEGVLRKIIFDNIKVIVILEFIVEEYPFSLPIELILVPFIAIIAIIAGMDVMAKADSKYAAVAKFTTGIQILFGFFIIFHVVSRAINEYQSLEIIDSIQRVLLAPILSVSLFPFIYTLLVITNYELLFVRLEINSLKEPGVEGYAKWRLLRHLRMRPKKIRDFLRAHSVDLINIRTKTDIDKLLSRKD